MQNSTTKLLWFTGLVSFYDTRPANEVGFYNAPQSTQDSNQK